MGLACPESVVHPVRCGNLNGQPRRIDASPTRAITRTPNPPPRRRGDEHEQLVARVAREDYALDDLLDASGYRALVEG